MSPKAQTKHVPVIQTPERLGDRSWRRDSMLYFLTSFLRRQPSLQAVDVRRHTVWLLDNTAYLRATPIAKGLKESWHAEVVSIVFQKDSRKDMSKIVAMIADLIGLDGEIGTERETRHQIAQRLRPFLYHVIPAHWMMLEIPQPNNSTIIHQLGPTNSNGISSQVVNMGSHHIADGAMIRSYLRGSRGNIAMETIFAGPKGWLVISDIDDTIKYTKTFEYIGILRATFVEEPRPIAGMPKLYSHLQRKLAPAWFYVSASPYNLYPFLRKFIHEHFRPGTLLLRDSSWLDLGELIKSFTVDTTKYKVKQIEKLQHRFPQRQVICIGDSAQGDPEAYAEIYKKYPHWIRAIWIRKVTNGPHLEEQNSPERFKTAFQGVPDRIWKVFEQPETMFDLIVADISPLRQDEIYLLRTEYRTYCILHLSKSIPQILLHNYFSTVISTLAADHYKPNNPTFKVGDVVFDLISNTRDGAAADYTHRQSSHHPRPALTAWQALFTYGGLDPTNTKGARHHELRVLVTNARKNEVAAQVLQLLRAPSLFPHYQPWIRATCSCPEHDDFPSNQVNVDTVIDAALPLPQDFDLAKTFRTNKWDPIDNDVDCTGEQMFKLARSSDVVRTTASSQPWRRNPPLQKPRPKNKACSAVNPDGKALTRIAELVEKGSIRGRVQSIVDLTHGVDVLSSEVAI
ncbi:hypothetical protein BDV28DRAFT_160820 [Aspergillus coremiiformis]|uniref:Phosphatidate phosphatase APP1 catalytic domain-containing protein n=1 Tax=Aspergillus coremiiformis TaxID=138285 RepID=A0A5N6YU89_9EURO|nr:hypothetical protein BDV28DRAFT_160820 [Aspergillus coremiiformis]